MDTFSPEKRKIIMKAIRGKHTKPEMVVRKIAHGLGYRYRLHKKDLPGKPDLTFSKLKKIIFVHGCFWHGHNCRAGKNQPKSNKEYWDEKLKKNQKRDQKNKKALEKMGWTILTIWECQTKDHETLKKAIKSYLEK